MKKLLKKLLTIGLSILLMFSVIACNGDKEPETVDELTMFRWDFAYVNTAKKMKSPLYKALIQKIRVEVPLTR